jgi:hypothetical protein
VGTRIEADEILVSFDAGGNHGELLISGLDADILLGVLPPFVLAALAAFLELLSLRIGRQATMMCSHMPTCLVDQL